MNMNKTLYLIILSIAICLIACEEESPIIVDVNCNEVVLSNYDEDWPFDPIFIDEVSLNDSILELSISHSGGCAIHEYQLIQEPLFCGTPPIFLVLRLSHEANDDMCEAITSDTLCFNIKAIYDNFPQDDVSIGLYNIHQPDTSWVFP